MTSRILTEWRVSLATCTVPYTRVALHQFRAFGDRFSPLGILAEWAHREKVCTREYDPINGAWEYDGLESLLSQRIQMWANLSGTDMNFILDTSQRCTSHEEVAAILAEHAFTPYELPIEKEYYIHG